MAVRLDSRLSRRLLDDGLLSAEQVELAADQQVLHGGALDTILLELDLVDEASLARALSEAWQTPLVARPEAKVSAEDAPRWLPSRTAVKMGLCPFAEDDGTLKVFCAAPLDRELIDELSGLLGRDLFAHVVPEVRLKAALSKAYGVPLEERYAALLRQLGETGELIVSQARAGSGGAQLDDGLPGWSLVEALTELVNQEDREGIADVAIRYAQQFLPFAALIGIRGGRAVGWKRGGPSEGAQFEHLPLDIPADSFLQQVLDSPSPLIGRPPLSEGNSTMFGWLGRRRPRTALFIPVSVSGQPIAVLYADGGVRPRTFDTVSDLVAFGARIGLAFEALLRARKKPSGKARPELPESLRRLGLTPLPDSAEIDSFEWPEHDSTGLFAVPVPPLSSRRMLEVASVPDGDEGPTEITAPPDQSDGGAGIPDDDGQGMPEPDQSFTLGTAIRFAPAEELSAPPPSLADADLPDELSGDVLPPPASLDVDLPDDGSRMPEPLGFVADSLDTSLQQALEDSFEDALELAAPKPALEDLAERMPEPSEALVDTEAAHEEAVELPQASELGAAFDEAFAPAESRPAPPSLVDDHVDISPPLSDDPLGGATLEDLPPIDEPFDAHALAPPSDIGVELPADEPLMPMPDADEMLALEPPGDGAMPLPMSMPDPLAAPALELLDDVALPEPASLVPPDDIGVELNDGSFMPEAGGSFMADAGDDGPHIAPPPTEDESSFADLFVGGESEAASAGFEDRDTEEINLPAPTRNVPPPMEPEPLTEEFEAPVVHTFMAPQDVFADPPSEKDLDPWDEDRPDTLADEPAVLDELNLDAALHLNEDEIHSFETSKSEPEPLPAELSTAPRPGENMFDEQSVELNVGDWRRAEVEHEQVEASDVPVDQPLFASDGSDDEEESISLAPAFGDDGVAFADNSEEEDIRLDAQMIAALDSAPEEPPQAPPSLDDVESLDTLDGDTDVVAIPFPEPEPSGAGPVVGMPLPAADRAPVPAASPALAGEESWDDIVLESAAPTAASSSPAAVSPAAVSPAAVSPTAVSPTAVSPAAVSPAAVTVDEGPVPTADSTFSTSGPVVVGEPLEPSGPVPDDDEPSVPPAPPPSAREMRTARDLVEMLESMDSARVKQAKRDLLALGEKAIFALRERFPGTLRVDPITQGASVETASELSALIEVLEDLGRDGLDAAVPHLDSPVAAHRYAAVFLFVLTPDERAIDLLRPRLHDQEPAIRTLAAAALSHFLAHPRFVTILEHLRARLDSPTPEARERAIALLGNFRDVAAVPALIELIEARGNRIPEAALSALRQITLQDHGLRARAWRKWWDRARKRSRVDWLIDGLRSKERGIRFFASTELYQLTPQDFGYECDAPKQERDRAVSRFEEWWEAERSRAHAS